MAGPGTTEPKDSITSVQSSGPQRRRMSQIGTGVAIGIAVVLLAVGIGGGYYWGHSTASSSSSSSSTTSQTQLTELGSSLLYPLMEEWAPNYTNHVDSNVIISPAAGGSTKGQTDAELGLVNIGASDGYLSNASSTGLINLPVAISAQLVYYNLPSFPSGEHLNLNGTMLADIYDGAITAWNNTLILGAQNASLKAYLNGLSSQTIYRAIRSDGSGDTFLFSSFCDMSSSGWPYTVNTTAFQGVSGATVITGSGNTGMISALQKQSNSVGYVGISYEASAAAAGLSYAALGDNVSLSASGGTTAANYILPTAATISQDANLGLTHLEFSTYQTAVSLILGGSPAGAITLIKGGGGTNPTASSPDPYPIVNLEYTLIKTAPTGTVVTSSALKATVQFLTWAITYGNYGTNGAASGEITFVNFVPLTAEVIGYDMQELATVQP